MMKQKEGKYIVDLIPKMVEGRIVVPKVEEKMLKEDVEKMLPEGFAFMSEKASGWHWEWVKKMLIGKDAIVCEVHTSPVHSTEIRPNGEIMEVWYYAYHVNLWYELGNGIDTKMDVVCRDIAMMIEDKYEIKLIKEDESILNKNPQEVQDYLNELAIAVCIRGERLEKYEKIAIKQCGSEAYANLKLFVDEMKRSLDRKKLTNTSEANLRYLARQIGVSDDTVDAIVKQFADKFEEEGRGRECQLLGVLVLDGSGSMEEKTAQQISKAKAVTLAVRDLFSRFKACSKRDNFNFAIVNYDHRSIVRMRPTPVKDIDDHGNYNPMVKLGGGTYISEGLKDAKKMAEDFLNQSQIDVSYRHVVVAIMTDGIDMTQPETIGIVNALKRMDNVKVTGCFFETVGADAKATDEAADYIKSLCSEERLFDRVSNVDDLRRFFINSMSQEKLI